MRVLLVGAGGREHALVWSLSRGGVGAQLYAAPGNPGIASLATCLPIAATSVQALAEAAVHLGIDLTIVGPEAPLAAGIVDAFRAKGLRIFGPTKAAADLEASKVFAKTLMRRHGIPTAEFAVFSDPNQAVAYVSRHPHPVVVKADGLAAGKGAIVTDSAAQAVEAVEGLMARRIFGDAGARVVIEDRLEGFEVSVLALVGPGGIVPLVPAQDYKRAYDGDAGSNTGGMGAISPAGASPELVGLVVDKILEPAAAAMAGEGRPYTGVLYAGVMVTADGPVVLEFNCRFGDPEAQVILPLLTTDLATTMVEILEGGVPRLQWNSGAAACVVLASSGYPGPCQTGFPIDGLQDLSAGTVVFHASTAIRDGVVVTAGGRVLNVVGTGQDLDHAVARAYAGVERISFEGMQFRTDIGRRSSVIGHSAEMASSIGGAKRHE